MRAILSYMYASMNEKLSDRIRLTIAPMNTEI